jgi:hypothetical protein
MWVKNSDSERERERERLKAKHSQNKEYKYKQSGDILNLECAIALNIWKIYICFYVLL